MVIIARGHSDAEVAHLSARGATAVVHGAEEIAQAMAALYAVQVGKANAPSLDVALLRDEPGDWTPNRQRRGH